MFNINHKTELMGNMIIEALKDRRWDQSNTSDISAEFQGNMHLDNNNAIWFNFIVRGVTVNNEVDEAFTFMIPDNCIDEDWRITDPDLAESLEKNGMNVWLSLRTSGSLMITNSEKLFS